MNCPALAIDAARRDRAEVFRAPPLLTLSEWAAQYLTLSAEDSAEPGRYLPDRAPYQRGIMDALTDPDIEEVVWISGAQVGKTLLLKALIGYLIHQHPCPILIVQPTVEMAETFSKDRLAPMIRDTAALTPLVAAPRSKSSGNTLLHKPFRGGHVTMAGANSPAGLASRPVRVVLCDEVDRYPISAGTEGDPVALATKRTATFWSRKIVLTSTPTIRGASRIETAYSKTDRRRYHVPCPHCGARQIIEWARIIYRDDNPDTAHMVCKECGACIDEREKLPMLAAGEWIAEGEFLGRAGFHISELYSPWRRWSDVVEDYLRAREHPEQLKTWVNTSLGETWEDRSGDAIDAGMLAGRRQQWDAMGPADIVLATAGVDVQDDRIEATIIGWTASQQMRVVQHVRLYGDPGQQAVWSELDRVLQLPIDLDDGRAVRVSAACVDSGGHYTQSVYDYCGARAGRRILAIKGRPGPYPIWPKFASKPKRKKLTGSVWLIGVDTAKSWLRGALAVRDPDMPHHVAFSDSLDDSYFAQLQSERRVTSYSKTGQPRYGWVRIAKRASESWDCLVYGLAALEALKSVGYKLKRPAAADAPAPTTDEVHPLIPRRKATPYATRWRS